MAVHLLISCAVIDHRLGTAAEQTIGTGLRSLYRSVQDRSFNTVPLTQPFSFARLIELVENLQQQFNKPTSVEASVTRLLMQRLPKS